MKRMVRLYAASTEYLAENLRAALTAAGVHSLLFRNQIPQEPGFNFGADWAYAEVFVNPSDEEVARAILAELLDTVCVADRGCETVYPPKINVRGYHWLAYLIVASWGLFAVPVLLNAWLLPETDRDADLVNLPVIIALYGSAFVLFVALLYANWARAKRIMQAIGPALMVALALPLWLSYELLRWCWNKLIHLAPLDS